MSRSYRKTPIFGYTCAESEKKDKQIWHKRMRRIENQKLHQIPFEKPYFPDRDENLEEYLDDVFGHYSCPFCNHYDRFDFGGYDHITTIEKDVSDTWVMAKDGKCYMDKERVKNYIKYVATRIRRPYSEERALHRLFAK